MSENKITPLQVVQRYHERYLSYEEAFNKDPFSEQDMRKELEKVATTDVDVESDEFLEKMLDIIVEKPQRRIEVNNAALKFCLFVDFYILTQEEELPDNILKDYNNLPVKDSLKSFYSVANGKFVKNEEIEITDDMKQYFKQVIQQMRGQ